MTLAFSLAVMAGVPLLAACGGTGDQERSGDEAYGQSLYAEALADYRPVLA